jgi:hypothetical protein
VEFLYFILCRQLKKIPTNDMPELNAMLLLGTAHAINLMTFIIVLRPSLRTAFQSRGEVILAASALGIIVYALDYLFLFRRREKIWQRFEEKHRQLLPRHHTYPIAYLVGSFGAIYAVSCYIG